MIGISEFKANRDAAIAASRQQLENRKQLEAMAELANDNLSKTMTTPEQLASNANAKWGPGEIQIGGLKPRFGSNSLIYDGNSLSVINGNGKTIYSTYATSGMGKYMNNPEFQHLENLGPIPEGEYYFRGKDWRALSPIEQAWRQFRGGDWGPYNVKLNPMTKGSRFGFYLHGGNYPGSAGCIDVLSNISKVYSLTRSQSLTRLTVKYD